MPLTVSRFVPIRREAGDAGGLLGVIATSVVLTVLALGVLRAEGLVAAAKLTPSDAVGPDSSRLVATLALIPLEALIVTLTAIFATYGRTRAIVIRPARRPGLEAGGRLEPRAVRHLGGVRRGGLGLRLADRRRPVLVDVRRHAAGRRTAEAGRPPRAVVLAVARADPLRVGGPRHDDGVGVPGDVRRNPARRAAPADRRRDHARRNYLMRGYAIVLRVPSLCCSRRWPRPIRTPGRGCDAPGLRAHGVIEALRPRLPAHIRVPRRARGRALRRAIQVLRHGTDGALDRILGQTVYRSTVTWVTCATP